MYIPDLTTFVGYGYENLSYPYARSSNTLGVNTWLLIYYCIYIHRMRRSDQTSMTSAVKFKHLLNCHFISCSWLYSQVMQKIIRGACMGSYIEFPKNIIWKHFWIKWWAYTPLTCYCQWLLNCSHITSTFIWGPLPEISKRSADI